MLQNTSNEPLDWTEFNCTFFVKEYRNGKIAKQYGSFNSLKAAERMASYNDRKDEGVTIDKDNYSVIVAQDKETKAVKQRFYYA